MSELLAPAGNIEALDAAIGEGADAVYLGLKSFNARLRTSNFAWNQFEATVKTLHKQNKKIYVTVNTVSEESETERLYRFLSYLNKIGPDGLIVQDLGVVRMCQEFFPDLELHASTQMNVESAAGVNLLSKAGLKRVVVARELGLEEIKYIKSHTNAEIEMFVHGALCVSESGLCLFSSFLGGKSANRGMCTQACRRYYTVDGEGGEKSGYYFSPCDLQLIEKIPDLMQLGVESFKIEGRMKSAEYVGSVVAAYRYLMDNWEKDRKGSIATAKRMLSTDFARAKTSYWYNFKTNDEGVANAGALILNPDQAGGTGIYLGKIDKIAPADDEAKNRAKEAAGKNADPKDYQIMMVHLSGGNYDPDVGDSIRLHRQDDSGRVSHKVRTVAEIDGLRMIDVPVGFKRGDSVYLLQTKAMSKRYRRVLPSDISDCRKQPGNETLPVLDLTPVAKNELNYFPEGLYFQVSTVSDIYQLLSKNPVRVILELNFETREDLLVKKAKIPISKRQMIISLDPYLAAAKEEQMASDLNGLIDEGFQTFVVNNMAHINMLKGKKNVNMIAGPYLYTFNRWAASWFENQNIGAFITPLENSFNNLKATWEPSVRSRVMVTAYAYPALFRMRFRLPETYDFLYFQDKEEKVFKVNSNIDGTVVMPEAPFSIVDKVDKIKSEGFGRILIDLSRTKVTRQELKTITNSMIKKQPIPECSRFNWKEGFYSPEKIEIYKAMNEKAAAERAAFGKSTARSSYKAKGAGRKSGNFNGRGKK